MSVTLHFIVRRQETDVDPLLANLYTARHLIQAHARSGAVTKARLMRKTTVF
jgi:hypothetical protein